MLDASAIRIVPRAVFAAEQVRVRTADFMRVDFAAIKQQTEAADLLSTRTIADLMAQAVWKLVGDEERMKQLLDQDVSDIAQVRIDAFDIGKIKAACKMALQQGWDIGTKQARREIMKSSGHKYGRETFAATSIRDRAAQYMDANAMRMAQNLGDGARSMIQQELTRGVRTGDTPAAIAAAILDRLESKGFTDRDGIEAAGVTQDILDELEALDDVPNVPAYINTLVRTNSFEALNEARFAEFTDPELEGWVEGLEYSAVMDERTTEFCQYMDERVYRADNEVWNEYRPPNHFNCRSLLIPVTKASGWDGEESDPPEMQPAEGFARCGCGTLHFEYDESQHPRDENGRWTDGGGGGEDTHELRGAGKGGGVTKEDVQRIAGEEGVKNVRIAPISDRERGGTRYRVLGQHDGKSGTVIINSKELRTLSEKELRGVIKHEGGHAELDRAWKARSSGVNDYIVDHNAALQRDDGTTAYSRGFWARFRQAEKELDWKDSIDRILLTRHHRNAIHESFAEMRRTGELKGSYKKLDSLVRAHNGR